MVQQWLPGGMQKLLGAWGTGWMLGAFAVAMLAPTTAAETTNKAASAILLSMGSPCGFVVTTLKPTRRIRRVRQDTQEQPAHHGGKT